MRNVVVFAAMVLGIAACGWGMVDDQSPFEPGKKPRAYPLRECKNFGPKSTDDTSFPTYDFAESKKSYPRVFITWDEKNICHVTLKDKVGSVLASATNGMTCSYATVYAADLNGDGRMDFTAMNWSSGFGLGAEVCCVTFFLSTPQGYTARAITAFDVWPHDFVDLNKDGKCEFVHTMFIFGEEGKDGKAHNYWVYNLLRFEGGDIVSANQFDKRFPVWIYYKLKPNHENTDQLTAEQRVRLWRKVAKEELSGDGRPLPASLVGLEKEQAWTVPSAATQPSGETEEKNGKRAGGKH